MKIDIRMEEVRKLAIQLMKKHKLDEWNFDFDKAKTRLGSCHHRTKTITVSKWLVKYGTDADILDTILHEIAHALVASFHGHDKVWKAKAIEIGCSGTRCHESPLPIADLYVGVCPHNHTITSFRRQQLSCGLCTPGEYSDKYTFTWYFHESILQPGDEENYKSRTKLQKVIEIAKKYNCESVVDRDGTVYNLHGERKIILKIGNNEKHN